jgi:Zn finger protein HypA/HybF involved in hydrogenase expression
MLVKCPQCKAWPMPLARKDPPISPDHLTFRCPKCHGQFVYTVGVAGTDSRRAEIKVMNLGQMPSRGGGLIQMLVYFSCHNCGAVYRTLQQRQADVATGSYKCVRCGQPVHRWYSGCDFKDWQLQSEVLDDDDVFAEDPKVYMAESRSVAPCPASRRPPSPPAVDQCEAP